MNIDQHSEILKNAHDIGKQKYPDAPSEHHAAFANSVAYLCTGASGGYGGPSCREHACGRKGGLVKLTGEWSFEDAIAFCDDLCYGQLTDYHRMLFRLEACFDEAQEDLEILRQFTYQKNKFCLTCGKLLSKQNRWGYCKKHRGRSPHRKLKK
jgi:hypothetical protein